MANAAVVFVLLILQGVWASAHAGVGRKTHVDAEMLKQEAIYRTHGDKVPGGYVTDRSLHAYADTLSFDFGDALARLGQNDRWLDIGAGRAQAILDYYAAGQEVVQLKRRELRGPRARAVAISLEDRRTPQWHETANRLGPKQIQYLHDKPLESYSTGQLGRFQVITDLLGGFSYTDDLSVFMEKVLAFLDVKGTFYTLLQDVKAEAGSNRPYYENSSFTTVLTRADGTEMKVCTWLKSISCVEVSCELRTEWKPPIEVYRIHKSCNKTEVPALTRSLYKAGTPPDRRFVFRD